MQNAGYLRVHKAAGWSRALGEFRSVTRFSLHLLYFGSTVNEWSYRNVPVLKDRALVSLWTRSTIYSDVHSVFMDKILCRFCLSSKCFTLQWSSGFPRSAHHPFVYLHHMRVMPSITMCLLTRSEEFCNPTWLDLKACMFTCPHKKIGTVNCLNLGHLQ